MIARRAEILLYLGKASTITEAGLALLDMLHPLAEQAVLDFLGSDLEYTQHTEFLPSTSTGSGGTASLDLSDVSVQEGRVVLNGSRSTTRKLCLQHTPLWSAGLQVWEDVGAYADQATSAFATDSLLTKGVDYYLDLEEDAGAIASDRSESGALVRIGGLGGTSQSLRRWAW